MRFLCSVVIKEMVYLLIIYLYQFSTLSILYADLLGGKVINVFWIDSLEWL